MSAVQVRLRVGSESYALPVEHVLEVGELEQVRPVPGSGPAVLGVLNLRGLVLAVFDLASVLGIASEGRPSRLVVAELEGQPAGLAVDEVIDVAPLTAPVEQADAGHLMGCTLENGRLIGIIDAAGMMAALAREAAR